MVFIQCSFFRLHVHSIVLSVLIIYLFATPKIITVLASGDCICFKIGNYNKLPKKYAINCHPELGSTVVYDNLYAQISHAKSGSASEINSG